MATLLKYNFKGEKVGEEKLDDSLLAEDYNERLVKECLIALSHNQRQWSANTKGRSEISYSNKKPHKQKGTGGARQGFLGAPQYRGGGVVFGPKPKFKQHIALNKKERQIALYQVLSKHLKEGTVRVIEEPVIEKPSTKGFTNFLKTSGLRGKNVLMLGEERDENLELSMRNVCNDLGGRRKKLSFKMTLNLNVHSLSLAEEIVLVDSVEAVKEILQRGKTISKKKEAK